MGREWISMGGGGHAHDHDHEEGLFEQFPRPPPSKPIWKIRNLKEVKILMVKCPLPVMAWGESDMKRDMDIFVTCP